MTNDRFFILLPPLHTFYHTLLLAMIQHSSQIIKKIICFSDRRKRKTIVKSISVSYWLKRSQFMKQKKILKSTLAVFICLGCIIGLLIYMWWSVTNYFKPHAHHIVEKEPYELSVETEDFYPVQEIEAKEDDGLTTIVVFGDDSFAYDRGPDGLASLLAEKCEATVYNCSFEGCSIAGETPVLDYENYPLECFSPLRLMYDLKYDNFITLDIAVDRLRAKNQLPDYFEDTIELLKNIDFDSVDIIIISNGINDYLKGHITTDLNDEYSSGSVYGSLMSCVDLIKELYPHIKVIISSPTFAYYTEEDGTLTSGEFRYTGTQTSETLGGYMINMKNAAVVKNVTFIDNYIGVEIDASNADKYLTDSTIVPNKEGRILIANHISTVINHYLF